MHKQKLEIRGIHRNDIFHYLVQLNGNYQEEQKLFINSQWQCEISEESYFIFLQSEIPIVFVTFSSENEETLDEIIRKFRLKTLRAGG